MGIIKNRDIKSDWVKIMIILLTNDDGINSKKLNYAKKILEKLGTVYVVAPLVEQSAKGMALTIGGFHYYRIGDYTYSVEGTPVDCINFALGGLNLKPDFVVSGINDGYNLGFDTKYSGTVGACFQAQYFDFKTIAFSSDNKGSIMVENEFENCLNYIIDNNLLSNQYTLNVNFPKDTLGRSKGIMHTNLFYQKYQYRPTMENNKYSPKRTLIKTNNLPKDSDAYAIRMGYISISKLTI